MKVKSRYRTFASGGAVTAEQSLPLPPGVTASIDTDASPHEMADHIDDASAAFAKQIAALREAEARQRGDQQATSREGRILQYRNKGFSQDQASYFNDLEENPHLVHQAILTARKDGLADETSQDFHDKVRANFQLLQGTHPKDIKLDPRPSEFSEQPAPEPAPQPKRRDRGGEVDEPSLSNRSGLYSAPVSRGDPPSASGEKPGRVTLSVEEKDMCRRLGMSEKDYAIGKLENEQKKRDGYYNS
jgi:hypothetical protein